MHGFKQSETCKTCQATISQPADACPNCQTHIFWLVVPKRALSALERKQFVREMQQITQLSIDQDYLLVDDHLWLPGDFWQQDPSGDSLRIFPWLSELELHQHAETSHEMPQARSETNDFNAQDRDTLPGITVSELEVEAEAKKREAQRQERQEMEAPRAAQQQVQNSQQRPRNPKTGASLPPPPKPIAPIAIFLFFVFMGLSYLSLQIQKNQRDIAYTTAKPTPVESSTEEEVDP